ncbi:MAG: S41 family peptidase [Acidobacteriota bacterium]
MIQTNLKECKLNGSFFYIIFFTFFISLYSFAVGDNVFFTKTPAISPDGEKVVFNYESDLWIVSSKGGTAYRLTAMEGEETSPRFSPDGKWIAFSGSRAGNNNVYLIPVNGGEIKQLTFHDSQDNVDSWSWDSSYIYFTSSRYNNFTSFKVNINGGTPVRIFDNFFNTIHNIVEDPDSPALYFNDTWESQIFYSRKKYKGDFNPDIKSYNPETKELVSHTTYRGKDLWHTVDRKGNIYFVSDENSGEFNLFTLKGGKKEQLTNYKSSVKFPQVNANGNKVVFEKDYQVFVYDVASKKTKKVEINLFSDNKLGLFRDFDISSKIFYFDISPDGKKIAFTSRGELFISDIKGKFIKKMNTKPDGRVMEVKWIYDSRTLIYNQTSGGYLNLYKMTSGVETEITSDNFDNRNISLNRARDRAIFLSGKRSVNIIDLKKFKIEKIAEKELWGFYNSTPQFSPDDKYIMFTAYNNFEQDIFITDLKNNTTLNITASGVTETAPFWSPDGKYIFFEANRYNPSYPRGSGMKIYMLPLEKYSGKFRSDEFLKLFEKKEKVFKGPAGNVVKRIKKKEKKVAVKIDFSDMSKRWKQVSPNPGSQANPFVILENGAINVLYTSNHEGKKFSLYNTILKSFEKPKTKKITGADTYGFNIVKGGKKYFTLVKGQIGTIDLIKNKFIPLKMSYKFRKNLRDEFDQMFYETWANLEANYYDEKFHGTNWDEMKIKYGKYLPFIRNRADLRILINDMLGELNSSHLGFTSRGKEERSIWSGRTSETGIVFENLDPFRINRILKNSPVDKKEIELRKGDELVSVNGSKIDPSKNREFYLSNPSVEKEMTLTFKRGLKTFSINIHPGNIRSNKRDLYNEWIDNNQARVDRLSNNRISYIYMKDMGERELANFLIDMNTEAYKKEALILDLRYNRGGNVHDAVLNFLSRKSYLLWKYRGGEYSPQPNFAPSSKPIVLLQNEQSLSDAEMTAAGFKHLKLGKIVGTESYRWIIFTSGKRLVDGSYYRLPSWGCYTLDKKDLEKTGVKPDIYIKNTLKDRLEGNDPQLDKAIEIILKQLK